MRDKSTQQQLLEPFLAATADVAMGRIPTSLDYDYRVITRLLGRVTQQVGLPGHPSIINDHQMTNNWRQQALEKLPEILPNYRLSLSDDWKAVIDRAQGLDRTASQTTGRGRILHTYAAMMFGVADAYLRSKGLQTFSVDVIDLVFDRIGESQRIGTRSFEIPTQL